MLYLLCSYQLYIVFDVRQFYCDITKLAILSSKNGSQNLPPQRFFFVFGAFFPFFPYFSSFLLTLIIEMSKNLPKVGFYEVLKEKKRKKFNIEAFYV